MKRKQTILVVDDDKEILSIISRTLELEGYDTATTTEATLAVTLLEEQRPDLVILDVTMPELDGFEVLHLMRQRSNIPVIMLTGRCEVDSLANALALGADDYVRKPFHTRELLARVRAKLRRAAPEATGLN